MSKFMDRKGWGMHCRIAVCALIAAVGYAQGQAGLAVPMPDPVKVTFSLPKGLPTDKGGDGKARCPKIVVVAGKDARLRMIEERYFPVRWQRGGNLPKPKGNAASLFTAQVAVGLEILEMRVEAMVLQVVSAIDDRKQRDKAARCAGMFVPTFDGARDIGLVVEAEHDVEQNGMPYVRGRITCSAAVGWNKDEELSDVWTVTFPQIVTSSVRFRYFYTEVPSCQVELAWPGYKPFPVEITADPVRR